MVELILTQMVNTKELRDYSLFKRLTTDLISEVSNEISDMSKPWSYRESYLEAAFSAKSFRDTIKSNSIPEITDLKNKLEVWVSYLKLTEKIKSFEQEVWFKGLKDIKYETSMTGIVSTPYTNYPYIDFLFEKRMYDTLVHIRTLQLTDYITLSSANYTSDPSMILKEIYALEEVADSLLHCFVEAYRNNKNSILDGVALKKSMTGESL